MSGNEAPPLLEVRDLEVLLPGGARAVEEISFHVDAGEVVALVGESGAGKSSIVAALAGLLPDPRSRARGAVRFEGEALLGAAPARLRELRGARIGVLLQDAASALDPVFTLGFQLEEAVAAHEALTRRARRARALELLARARLPDPPSLLAAYPHQLSGGQRQRVALALALAGEPRLLLADEPTAGLDPTAHADLCGLLAGLVRERGLAMLLVTHDLGAVAALADRALVLYAGRIVEEGRVERLLDAPRHHGSAALFGAWPRPGRPAPRALPGASPSPGKRPPGCAFHPRCARADARCAAEVPALVDGVRCFHPLAGGGP